MYDEWAKLDGISKEDAMKQFNAGVKPIIKRAGFDYENPKKKLIEDTYNKCVEE